MAHFACEEGHTGVHVIERDEDGGRDVQADGGQRSSGQGLSLVQGELAFAAAERGRVGKR